MTWTAELAKKITGQVLTDDASRQALSGDFGRVVERNPAAVVCPRSAADVAEVIKFAASRALHITARGAGHSQSGQSLSDHIALDMRALDQILRIGAEPATVVCQAGITWRALLDHLLPLGLSPPVLTNNLDVTVGGSLSTAGLGVASWRHGTQADHCLQLEIVTGQGEILSCSSSMHKQIFDAARAGLGQFGIITEVTLRLRRHRPEVRTFYLLYDEFSVLLSDLKTIMDEERFDYIESWCAPLPQGFRMMGGEPQPFAQWFFPLQVTLEVEGSRGQDEMLRGLKFYQHVHTEENAISAFFTRLDSLFTLWKRGGFWDYAHPWMECILPWDAAPAYVSETLRNIPAQALLGGHILLWPGRGSASAVPLFMRPEGNDLIGFGFLPAVPPHLLHQALPLVEKASQAATLMGGKRYLSGWLAFVPAQWQAHYGQFWTEWVALKEKYDPLGILNPALINP